ncbi:AEL_HP2_G0041370.mRNA.1.CDS.1 [Saccharomyces cerevisiae]|nr:AEL_HP2_G0041370.mRNA.1.CDS.1 [Saccharomyces cerevisiae]CAI6674108.1 AEL_HP2_G0041370.mRNA.1.CDS.1 [Saccharomyces cerevisiae]
MSDFLKISLQMTMKVIAGATAFRSNKISMAIDIAQPFSLVTHPELLHSVCRSKSQEFSTLLLPLKVLFSQLRDAMCSTYGCYSYIPSQLYPCPFSLNQ